MGVFSRCKAVLEADDSPMPGEDRAATHQPRARRVSGRYPGRIRLRYALRALTWFEQHGTETGDYGTANSIATARGISVESVRHAGIVEAAAGKVRILARDDIDPHWDPAEDAHLTVWECSQHLVRVLEHDGETGAATLLRKSVPAMRTRPRTSPIASTTSRPTNAGTRAKRRRGTA